MRARQLANTQPEILLGEDRPFGRPGGHGEGDPPDPIPNSAVKPLSADGTAS